jgi:drug/metabolite transporter (DMT)-like permease
LELVLLGILATLWGASYTFIKVGVETIPPLTLIAVRTLIAGAQSGALPINDRKRGLRGFAEADIRGGRSVSVVQTPSRCRIFPARARSRLQ